MKHNLKCYKCGGEVDMQITGMYKGVYMCMGNEYDTHLKVLSLCLAQKCKMLKATTVANVELVSWKDNPN